jgi:biotin-dependent carboxylase-like uncharacterized protein
MSLVVRVTGPRTTVQDRGRPGRGALGISPSGAADRAALALGNRLLGNAESAAGLECTMGGLVLQGDSPHWCAVTGAEGAVTVDGRPMVVGIPFFAPAGSELSIGAPTRGVRSYLTVAGGLTTPTLLGSRSEDTLGRLVPHAIDVGTVVPVGPAGLIPRVDHPHNSPLPPRGTLTLAVSAGPRHDWIAPEAWHTFTSATFAVSDRFDRIGVRFEGPALARTVTRELPSEGLIRGAIQVPPSGAPIAFLADHPTTGGYPVIGVIGDAATDLLAQVVPGQRVRFTDTTRAGRRGLD